VCFPLGDTTTGAILLVGFSVPAPVFFDELFGEAEAAGGGLFELDLIEQDWPIKTDNSRNRGSMPFNKFNLRNSNEEIFVSSLITKSLFSS